MSYNINAINDYTYGNFTIKIIIKRKKNIPLEE